MRPGFSSSLTEVCVVWSFVYLALRRSLDGAEPSAPTGGLVGVSGAARDAAALAPAHGGPSLDVPVDSQGTASGLR